MDFFDSDIEELNIRIIHVFMNVFFIIYMLNSHVHDCFLLLYTCTLNSHVHDFFWDYIHTYIDLRYFFLDYIHVYVKVMNVRNVKNEYGEC